ncbi:MAG: twin-arginine translocase TatA/TatE family subunit [Legionellales bacterium]|nr:twin-arginine translocase TatA/TatE family subunit [Legionellales bacterium]
MSISELLLIFTVVLVVFGPNQLPMLARHLGKITARLNGYKQQATLFWQQQQKEIQLEDNIRKALKADEGYSKIDGLRGDK